MRKKYKIHSRKTLSKHFDTSLLIHNYLYSLIIVKNKEAFEDAQSLLILTPTLNFVMTPFQKH